MSTLRKIEDVEHHSNFVVKNLWKVVGFGVMLSLAVPAQGLGDYELKGPSILSMMDTEYWEAVFGIAILYIGCFIVFHFGWKLQDSLYLKELNEKKDQLIKELGIIVDKGQPPSNL